MTRLEGAGGPDYSSFKVGSASGDERVTIVDRAFELLYRRGTGPIAGRAELRRRERATEPEDDEIGGFAGINVLPTHAEAFIVVATVAASILAVVAAAKEVRALSAGNITKK